MRTPSRQAVPAAWLAAGAGRRHANLNMMSKRVSLASCALVLILGLSLFSVLQAAEQVKGVSLFAEPLTVEAVPGKQRHRLAVLPQPRISSPVYALRGKIRYEGVEGDAYLQLNSDFGDAGVFFTKGLAQSGPMGKISGSSPWRNFVLPFFANQGEVASEPPAVPDELTLELYLPAAGSVTIRDVRLYLYAANEDPLASVSEEFAFPNPQIRSALNWLIVLLFVVALGILAFRGIGKTK